MTEGSECVTFTRENAECLALTCEILKRVEEAQNTGFKAVNERLDTLHTSMKKQREECDAKLDKKVAALDERIKPLETFKTQTTTALLTINGILGLVLSLKVLLGKILGVL
jgi:hypothetical protein